MHRITVSLNRHSQSNGLPPFATNDGVTCPDVDCSEVVVGIPLIPAVINASGLWKDKDESERVFVCFPNALEVRRSTPVPQREPPLVAMFALSAEGMAMQPETVLWPISGAPRIPDRLITASAPNQADKRLIA